MFAFAMITGVKQGWLDAATYGPAARRSWLGLVAELDADANAYCLIASRRSEPFAPNESPAVAVGREEVA